MSTATHLEKPVSDVKDNSTTNTTNAINNTDVPAAGEPPMKSPAKPAVETHLEKTGLPIVALVLVVLAAVGLYRRD
ncbi:MAG: hypothetical protein Q4P18_07880 [Methanobrevibacter sp.]|uniref:hypothetical protein n=1 Tax=Methanobrevibacter sp. TaxID=66852 RepID=UPI0026DF4919|nr:hypothetical protein [Methanobrevibacter sp.]MDO5849439.1 hypothetical protein [Methanobrevibacter sp.]